jgi:flavin reductase (DIM6/NTAB) family NADH-FMN oxidoreductase RutF/rubredoxin
MYLVSSKKGEKYNGQIANTVFQITSEPPTIAVSINKQNLTHEFIRESKVFTVAILNKDVPMTFIGLFGFKSGREVEKFEGIKYRPGQTGVPIVLDYSIGFLEAQVIDEIDVGTHTIFLGRVIDADIFVDEEPMTYAYYHEIKRGAAPKTAPTYIENVSPGEVGSGGKYKCNVCGYVYDQEQGDPEAGIEPGTPFSRLPADWVCPICGAGKQQFSKED